MKRLIIGLIIIPLLFGMLYAVPYIFRFVEWLIKIDNTEKNLKIDVNIIVEYGARIPDIAYEIQKRVKKAVEGMTGLNVEEVNVHVQGVNTNSQNKEANKENNEE